VTDRWVCKRCFADNNETEAACQRCGLIRGAEATPADQTSWAASPAGTATATPDPGWRRYLRFWWIPALAIALVVGYLTTARRDDDGSLATAGTVSVDDLREGDCFNTSDDVEISDVDGVPCTEPHAYEVFALATYEGDGTYPPDSQLDGIFTQVCEPSFETYVGLPYADSVIYGNMISPSEESWSKGDRSFICVLFDRNDDTLTESLAGANR
jgi:hypothetical protein